MVFPAVLSAPVVSRGDPTRPPDHTSSDFWTIGENLPGKLHFYRWIRLGIKMSTPDFAKKHGLLIRIIRGYSSNSHNMSFHLVLKWYPPNETAVWGFLIQNWHYTPSQWDFPHRISYQSFGFYWLKLTKRPRGSDHHRSKKAGGDMWQVSIVQDVQVNINWAFIQWYFNDI